MSKMIHLITAIIVSPIHDAHKKKLKKNSNPYCYDFAAIKEFTGPSTKMCRIFFEGKKNRRIVDEKLNPIVFEPTYKIKCSVCSL